MKKITFILTVLGITLSACANKNTKDTSLQEISEETSLNGEKGEVIHLTKDLFLSQIWDYSTSPQAWKYKGEKPAIIDFYADWCGPCRIASPILDEISKEYAGKIQVFKIDTQKERELASVFGIQSIPAFLYVPAHGKPTMMAGIGQSKEETRNMFIENINKLLLTKE